MMRRIFALIVVIVAMIAGVVAGPAMAQDTPFRPVATVNDSVITGFDLSQRARILIYLGYPENDTQGLRTTALDQLIEDRLKTQAGKAIGLSPNDDLIKEGVETFAARAGLSPEAFRDRLKANGITDQALDDVAAAEMIWIQVVRSRFQSRVDASEAEVDAEIALSQQQSGYRYELSEIRLQDNGKGRSSAQTRALAEQLYQELNNGGDFAAAAARYSDARSGANGGALGWVDARNLPAQILQGLQNLPVGGVAIPVQVESAIVLLRMDNRQKSGAKAATNDPDLREKIRSNLMEEQLNHLADGYLQELRRDARIELR